MSRGWLKYDYIVASSIYLVGDFIDYAYIIIRSFPVISQACATSGRLRHSNLQRHLACDHARTGIFLFESAQTRGGFHYKNGHRPHTVNISKLSVLILVHVVWKSRSVFH